MGRFIQQHLMVSCLFSLSLAGVGAQTIAPKYQAIIDREPFGSPPAVEEEQHPTAMQDATAIAELSKDLRLSMLLADEDGGELRAGLQRVTPKPNEAKGFILSVGETVQGIKLVDVDIEKSQALVERNGVSVMFKLDKGKAVAEKTSANANPRRLQRRQPQPQKPNPEVEAWNRMSKAEKEAHRKEVRKQLQDYQMEVIRQGMPPLPVPLTPEMDAQLVNEGILPPAQ